MYLLDTNHCSRIIFGDTNIIRQLQEHIGLGVATSVIVQGELLYMVQKSEQQVSNLQQIRSFLQTEEKLQLKRKMSAANAALEVARILSFSRMVTITKTLQRIAPDPDDDMVLECAVVVRGSHIVTGDRDFLSFSCYQGIAIVSAADFQALLS